MNAHIKRQGKNSRLENKMKKIVKTKCQKVKRISKQQSIKPKILWDVPSDKKIDNSLCLLLEGYEFIQNRCKKYKTDIFKTKLMGETVICVSGEEASRIFYDDKKFIRKGAAPKRVQKTLFGQGGVQAMDARAHKHRKTMFMNIMTPYNLGTLSDLMKDACDLATLRWQRMSFPSGNTTASNSKNIVLFDEMQKILCKVACQWAGIPLSSSELKLRASDLGKMVDGFGGIGLRYYEGKYARRRTEKWMRDIVKQIRNKKIKPAKNTAAYTIVWHKELNGKLLSTQIAAVELINIIRPIVAIATYITFGALAMYQYSDCRSKIQKNENNYTHMFVQEVRRFYPFTPFVGARVKSDFIWNNCHFRKGTLVILDVYGIDHDSRLWKKPYEFIPERFGIWNGNPFSFIPQGGGDFFKGHRCPGEMVTIEIMKAGLSYLANNLEYHVPRQNLKYSMSRIPTLPQSRFVITKVKLVKK